MSFEEIFGISGLRLAALFLFTAATAGLLFFLWRHPRGSDVRKAGIRLSLVVGFLATAALVGSEGGLDETTSLIALCLGLSFLAFEFTERFLR